MASSARSGLTVREKIDQTVDESLESTRRIRRLAEETTEVGIKTAEELDYQGEKLQNIERNLDNIHDDLKAAEKQLNQMDKFLGFIKFPKFKRKKQVKAMDTAWEQSGQGNPDDVDSGLSASAKPMPLSKAAARQADGPIIRKIVNDAREDEMEDNLNAVDHMLAGMKNLALDMGNKLDEQNHLIGRLSDRSDLLNIRIEANDQRIRKKL